MNKILEAVKNAAHGTSLQIAALANMEPREVIAELQTLHGKGIVTQLNGFWSVVGVPAKGERQLSLVEIIAKRGRATPDELVQATGRNRLSINTELRRLVLDRLIYRELFSGVGTYLISTPEKSWN